MHHHIFGHSFAELVALILLPGLAIYFLNKKKISASRNAEDVDIGTSGSITSLTRNCYEVFLSFRGLDTRQSFADHLYNGLIDARIDAFRDDDKLPEGENIRPELLAAITNSKISIPILSQNYGTSSWCLDELVQIMECKKNNGQIVLPIFYNVKPADVRKQSGSFGDAFHHSKRRFDRTILEKWKKALTEVGQLKGYEANMYETELVKRVVRKVLSKLKQKCESVFSENLVGIDTRVKEVMEFVDNNSQATLFIGIYGMGGIGKTTLAKAIYKKLSNLFEHRSFIANIRESWNDNNVHYLQNRLINDILKRKNEDCNEEDVTNFIFSKFKGTKVLVLLDDVDDVEQLKCLVGNRDRFSLGSRIIITTRDKRILDKVKVDLPYDHKEMDEVQSLTLFCKHAFRRDTPPREFKNLAHEVVSIAGGLPLSLEVFGSLLSIQELALWRGTIDKLKEVPPKKVQKKLMISYEALDYCQKQIFLDIACFLNGTDKRIACYMWDACRFHPEEGIRVLRLMSLIKIGNDHELQMHDQLRDLGRTIVCEGNQQEPWHRSRLWDSKEALKVLKIDKEMEKIEAIVLSEGNFGETAERDGVIYTGKQFKNLIKLRFLHLEGPRLTGDFKDTMQWLRWLRWQNCPMNFDVNNFHVKELAALELSFSEINEQWEGWSSFMMAKELKFLDLSSCGSLENTDFLLAFKNLEVLILNNCSKLQQISSSIGDMKALLRLELCQCMSLMKLPIEIGKLEALKQLLLPYTSALSALPYSIGSLQNLEILNISHSGINELPNNIGRLRKLRELHASNCHNLVGEMPESIGSLENLEILDISQYVGRLDEIMCQVLREELPESMCNLSSPQRLDVLGCNTLQSLPNLPSSLTYLGVTCQSCKLPSLSHLTHLKELRLRECEFLECIQELPLTLLKNSECSQPIDVEESELPQSLNTPFKLEILEVDDCESIKILDVSQSIHLRTLSIHSCEKLVEIRGLNQLKVLEKLNIFECTSIKRLNLPKSKDFMKLAIKNCNNLVEIHGLHRLEFLKELHISKCASIERLDLQKCESPKNLSTGCCENLVEHRSPNRLKHLKIYECASIKRLNLPKSNIRIVDVQNCNDLVEIQGLDMLEFDMLEFLEYLDITECTSIKSLDLSKFVGMKQLNAENCTNLIEIHGLNRLKFLEYLDISRCVSIERLDLSKSVELKLLDAENCVNLVEIHGLDKLEFLEYLDVSWCTSIKRLDLPKFVGMKVLHATNCTSLVEIHDLDRLKFLEELNISQCTSIKRLDLPKFASMMVLYAENCKSLVEIHDLNKLESLKELDISGCALIERLDLSKSMGMKILNAENCVNLIEIDGLDRLEFLVKLNIFGCTSFEGLPNLCCFDTLQDLTIDCCDKLKDIRSLERFPSCTNLCIKDCRSLARLPNLSSFHNLRRLVLSNCYELREIPGLEESISLEVIAISGCFSIEILPDLSSCTRLIILVVQDCEKLTELRGLEKLEQLKRLDISGCKSLKTIPELPKTRLHQNYEYKASAYYRRIEFGLNRQYIPYVTRKILRQKMAQQWKLEVMSNQIW